MKRLIPIFLVFVLVLVLLRLLIERSVDTVPGDSTNREPAASTAAVAAIVVPAPVSSSHPPLPGEVILRDYGRKDLPAENDLVLMSRLMENFTLLVKSMADRPLSANEDWAAALRGQNPAQERFLPDQHVALDARGRLVDRWGTPLFFHALGGRQFEIRSAGPDRTLWTADDLHRNADGSFKRGESLNPPSLMEASRANRTNR